jgi:hypothetical protein
MVMISVTALANNPRDTTEETVLFGLFELLGK